MALKKPATSAAPATGDTQTTADAIPVDHPAVDNNSRADTSAVQNGGDFNDPHRRHPSDPGFAGQGLDLSVYGKADAPKSDDK